MLLTTEIAPSVSTAVSLPLSLTHTALDIHNDNVAKGFYDDEKALFETLGLNLPEHVRDNPVFLPFIERMITMARLMLLTTEVAEAVEGIRKNDVKGADFDILAIADVEDMTNDEYAALYKDNVKDCFEAELAGTFIRLMDLCGRLGVDIDGYVRAELRFNRTRPYKHGKNS